MRKNTWTSISEESSEVKIQEYRDAASGSPDNRSTKTWENMIEINASAKNTAQIKYIKTVKNHWLVKRTVQN